MAYETASPVVREMQSKSVGATARLSERPKSRTLTPPDAGEDMEPRGLLFSAGTQNGAATLGDSSAVPYKTKHSRSTGATFIRRS